MEMKAIVDDVIEESSGRLDGGPAAGLTVVVETAKHQLAVVTGLKPVAVSRVTREEGRWHLRIDMLEMARIPSSSDLIGEYEVDLDESGTLARFERRRSRHRGDVSEELGV